MQQNAAQELTPETTAALREWLDQELDALPSKYRRPLVMVHLEGCSLEETAAALKCKDGTLRVWLNRAREKLRHRLARRGASVTVPGLIAWLASQARRSRQPSRQNWGRPPRRAQSSGSPAGRPQPGSPQISSPQQKQPSTPCSSPNSNPPP